MKDQLHVGEMVNVRIKMGLHLLVQPLVGRMMVD